MNFLKSKLGLRIIWSLIGLASSALAVFIKGKRKWYSIPLMVALMLVASFSFFNASRETPQALAAATFTLAQAAVTEITNPSTPTLGSTPTEGNLLVVMATERSGTSHTAFTINGTGWTKVIGQDNELTDSQARISLAVWIKKAGAAEPTSVSIDNGTANNIRATIMEIAPSEAVETFTLVASAGQGSGAQGSGGSPESGPTSDPSVAAGNYLVIALAGWREQGHATTRITNVTWTGSMDSTTTVGSAANGQVHSIAFKDDTTGGTYQFDVSWTSADDDEDENITAVLVIEADTGGGGEEPVVIQQQDVFWFD